MTLGVVEVGDADLPAVVLAHGAGSTSGLVIRAFAAPVEAAGMRLIAYDLRGHASSTPLADPRAHTLDEQVADLAEVARRFDATIVGGVSVGARIAVAYALAARQVEGLLLALPAWLGDGNLSSALTRSTADGLRRDGVPVALHRLDEDTAVPDWLVMELRAAWSQHDPRSLAAALDAVAGMPPPDEVALRALSAPTGVTGAPDDRAHPLADAKRYASTLPRAVLWRTSLAAIGFDRTKLGASTVGAWQQARRLT